MDNLAVHKRAAIRRLLRGAGCQVLFLPSYSPDFNPIELVFAQIRPYLRRVGARTREALEAAIARAIDPVTASEARLLPSLWLSNSRPMIQRSALGGRFAASSALPG